MKKSKHYEIREVYYIGERDANSFPIGLGFRLMHRNPDKFGLYERKGDKVEIFLEWVQDFSTYKEAEEFLKSLAKGQHDKS